MRPCLDCRTPTDGNRCPTCRTQRERDRGSTTARGYGHHHQQARAAWVPKVATGLVLCARCDQPIGAADDWDLDHADDRVTYLGPAHADCNRGKRPPVPR